MEDDQLPESLHIPATTARALSTSFTARIANPFVSLLEYVAAVVVLIIALLSPLLGLAIMVSGIVFMAKMARRAHRMLHKWRKGGIPPLDELMAAHAADDDRLAVKARLLS